MAAPFGIAPKAWRYPVFFENYSHNNFNEFKAELHAAWNPETRMCQYLLGTCQKPCAIRDYAESVRKLAAEPETDEGMAAESITWTQLETDSRATITPAAAAAKQTQSAPKCKILRLARTPAATSKQTAARQRR